MRLRLIRHATLILEYNGKRLLVDPMLSDEGAQQPIANAPNPRKFPLCPLPLSVPELLDALDAVLVTHTHRDHWDEPAAELIPKSLPILGQPEDEAKFRQQGFHQVQPIMTALEWNGIQITRTGGQHGTGEIGKKMAPVSGYVLRAPGGPTIYIAGDTIWCPEVESALEQFRPRIAVVNAGAAQFLEGAPITMTAEDVIRVCQAASNTQVVADHMETVNHCLLSRADLAFQLEAARVIGQVAIPNDGDWVDVDGQQ